MTASLSLVREHFRVLLLSGLFALMSACGGGGGSQPNVTGLQIEPAAPTLAKGTSIQLDVMLLYSDGSKVDISDSVMWTSADDTVATVSNSADSQGKLSGLKIGTVAITGTYAGQSASVNVTVTPAIVMALAIDPVQASVAKGTTQTLKATATFSDATTQDVTADAVWSSSNATIAAVGNEAANKGQVSGLATGVTHINATYASMQATASVTVTNATLRTVEVTPSNPSFAKGTTGQLQATAVFSDDSTQDVTTAAGWSSSDSATISVDNKGSVKALAEGAATITATYMGQSAATTVTGTAAVIVGVAVSPGTASIAKGTDTQFSATATFTDGSSQDVTAMATWASSHIAIATISNAASSSGRTHGVSEGTTDISAMYMNFTGSAALTVTAAIITRIEVTPSSATVAKGTTKQFQATAIFSDDSSQDVTATAAWSIASGNAATVGNSGALKGLVTGVAEGAATVKAAFQMIEGSAAVTVSPAVVNSVEISPTGPTIAKGTTQQFVATAIFSDASSKDVSSEATWSSADTTVATVSNAAGSKGLAKGLVIGSAVVSASYSGKSGSATLAVTDAVLAALEVTPANASIPVGLAQQYKATGVFTDGSTQDFTGSVTWASSATATIDISNADATKGFAVAGKQGQATISAMSGAITGSTPVNVTSATLSSIQLSPISGKLAAGFKLPYHATGTFSDGTTRDLTESVTWATSDASLASASNANGSRGVVTGASPGSVFVTATQGAVKSSNASLAVTSATLTTIQLTPNAATLPLGTMQQFKATGTFSDSTTQDLTNQVTWGSDDSAIVTVSNATNGAGLATSVAVGGPINVKATHGVISGAAPVTVTNAALTAIAVTPASVSIAKGLQQQFVATGSYTDGTTHNITSEVTWSSSDSSVASISNANDDSKGLATAAALGNVAIQASQGSISGASHLTVTAAALQSIAVTPDTASIPKGAQQQFQATGTYTDGTTRNVTGEITWASSAASIATVSNAKADAGRATAAGVGDATISATSGDVSGAAALNVTSAVLDHILIGPSPLSAPAGNSLQLSAMGVLTDGSTESLTKAVTWSSSDVSIVDVSNGANSQGLALAKTAGSANVTATDPDTSISVTASFTVSPAILTAIVITPAGSDLPVGFGRAYMAAGQYSDGQQRDVTTQVSWSTLNPAVVTIDDADSKGFAQAMAAGSTTVVATLNSVTGTTTVRAVTKSLASIAVSPANTTIGRGKTLQYTATGTFADASTLDLTTQVTWASSNTNAATISNAVGSKGLARAGTLLGKTTISATNGAVVGTAQLQRTIN